MPVSLPAIEQSATESARHMREMLFVKAHLVQYAELVSERCLLQWPDYSAACNAEVLLSWEPPWKDDMHTDSINNVVAIHVQRTSFELD